MTGQPGLWQLIGANMRQQPARTLVLGALVALFCFTLFAGTMLGQKAGQGTRLVSERLGADILFVPYGHDAKAQNALLRGEPSSFYMDRAFSEELRREPGVERVTTQLFLATLKASCCSLPVQLIGCDPGTDFVVRPWMDKALSRPMHEDEVVVGCKIAGEAGGTIKLFGKEFRIAARLDPTGMGFDTSVFLDQDRARRLLLLSDLGPQLKLPEGLDRNTFVSSTLVKASPSTGVADLANALSEKYAIKYNLDFVVVPEMLSDIASSLRLFATVFYGLAAGLWAVAVCTVSLVFSLMVRERRREFGIMRLMGATHGHLVRIVMGEALLVSGAGALAGTALAGALLALFGTWIEVALRLPRTGFGVAELLATGACTCALGMLAAPLACLPVARSICRQEAYDAAREDA